MTYIGKDGGFNDEHKMAVKIQIDNSLRLGWKREDIIIVTNFPYEYNGVKSLVVSGDIFCDAHWPATKINGIVELFRRGLIGDGIYWNHDFDCFQLNEFGDVDIPDMGLTNYGRMLRLCSASMFFKKEARDIFENLKKSVELSGVDEETTLANTINKSEELQKRIKLLNITYAFHKFNLLSCYKIAEKPIKAVHFHLTPDKYNFYIKGENKLKRALIPVPLIKIFNKHGWIEQ